MGNPKQKWTAEEEEALRAGVKKHGTGKWKDIQKDPEFNPFLCSRSNIDLKDKWRNMTVNSGNGTREKSRAPKAKANPDASAAPLSLPQTSASATVRRDAPAAAPVRRDAPAVTPVRRDVPAAAPVRHDAAAAPVTDDSSTGVPDAKSGPMYDAMIFEALSTSTEPNGLDNGAIASYIEQRNEVPQNFKRSLTQRLRRLVQQEKLEKINNCYYKVKTASSCETKPPAPKQKDIQPRQFQSPGYVSPGDTIEEAAVAAAYKIAEAENKSFGAAEAVKEAERISHMFEDTESLLQLANEIFEKCSQGEVVPMA